MGNAARDRHGRLRVPAFRGPEALYGSGYSDQQLRPWAARIHDWLAQGLDVYAYFNNDVPDHAPRDAQRPREMLGGPAPVVITPTPTEVEYVQRPWLPER